MEAFVNENVSAEYAGQALDLLKLKKIYCTDAVLRTDEDINNVLSLWQMPSEFHPKQSAS